MYVVTGASAGIGRAVAAAIASRNLGVLAVARNTKELEALAAQFRPWIKPVTADLATVDGVDKVSAAISGETVLAGVVHAAGSLVPLESYDSVKTTDLVKHFRIHVATPIALYQALVETCRIDRMVTIDSYSAASPRHGWAAYSIVKAAAQMAAKCAAQELPDTETMRIFPGAVNTRIVDTVLASKTETAKAFSGMLERGEFAEPHEIATFITSLLIDATTDLLRTHESWDYNCPAHRETVCRLQQASNS